MKKFNKGDRVRYVGKIGHWNPVKGAIGTVIKSDEHGVNYIVRFSADAIPVIFSLGIIPNFWYHIDELEAVNEEKSDVKMMSASQNWSFA